MKIALALILALASPVALAAINVGMDGLVSFLIYLIVVGLIFWLLWWLLSYCAIPEPFNKIARVVLAVVAVLVCINLLLGLAGTPLIHFR